MLAKLPYTPSPYPDEILGSWLARVARSNEKGAWSHLLSQIGITKRHQSVLFDMLTLTPSLGMLLASLGITYEEMLLHRTTYPYWATFHADVERRIPGAESLPALRVNQYPVDDLSRLGYSYLQRRSMKVAYCPSCLADDVEKWGEPFWHISHQLPNTFYCTTHRCKLRGTCSQCGVFMASRGVGAMTLPKLTCICGANLSLPSDMAAPNDAFLRLSDLSVEALRSSPPDWDFFMVKATVARILEERGGSRHVRRYGYEQLQKSFGWPDARGFNGEMGNPVDGAKSPLRTEGNLAYWAAGEFCAIGVALGFDAQGLFTQFSQGKTAVFKNKERRVVAGDLNFDGLAPQDARDALEKWIAEHPNRGTAGDAGKLYWFLRLYDRDWLRTRTSGSSERRRLRTLNEDRKELVELLESFAGSYTQLQNRLGSLAAYQRATLRDKEWIGSKVEGAHKEELAKRQKKKVQSQEMLEAALLTEIEARLVSEDRPVKISASNLANSIGLSAAQAMAFLKARPHLREAIEQANSTRKYRVLMWAATQLLAEGQDLVVWKIAARAGVTCYPHVVPLVQEVIKQKTEMATDEP